MGNDALEATGKPATAPTAATPESTGLARAPSASGMVTVEFCGEWYRPSWEREFAIGREGDLRVDDNPYLHRRFLTIELSGGMWWLHNVGSTISATISNAEGTMQAWLSPGASLPILFALTNVSFTAGSTAYGFTIYVREPVYQSAGPGALSQSGDTTIVPSAFTLTQKQLIVALAEPLLKSEAKGVGSLPSSAQAAARLGWALTKFNRKLDNVCDKLDRSGVRGLRGGAGALATNRRARLVEYAIASRLVTPADLPLLDVSDDLDPA